MRNILTILKKEVADFTSSIYGIGALMLFLILAFGFLWVLPISSYESYGVAAPDLYFQFISYFFLLIIPLITIGNLGKEYKYGTFELMRSRGITWFQIVLAKFGLILLIAIITMLISVVHLWVVDDLAIDYSLSSWQIIGSYIGLILVCAIYTSVSLAVGAVLQQATIAILLSITICFILYSGISFIGEADIWSQDTSYILSSLSLAHQVDEVSRGVMRLSSMVYMLSIVIIMLLLSNLFFSKIEN